MSMFQALSATLYPHKVSMRKRGSPETQFTGRQNPQKRAYCRAPSNHSEHTEPFGTRQVALERERSAASRYHSRFSIWGLSGCHVADSAAAAKARLNRRLVAITAGSLLGHAKAKTGFRKCSEALDTLHSCRWRCSVSAGSSAAGCCSAEQLRHTRLADRCIGPEPLTTLLATSLILSLLALMLVVLHSCARLFADYL